MAKSVGLDIHPRGVRAVEIAGSGKNFRVLRYMEREVTPRGGALDADELNEALDEIFKGGKFTKNHVVTAVDANETVVREIPVPFTSDDQIRKVVKYEAEHHLHDCDADDVVVQYTKVGESTDGTWEELAERVSQREISSRSASDFDWAIAPASRRRRCHTMTWQPRDFSFATAAFGWVTPPMWVGFRQRYWNHSPISMRWRWSPTMTGRCSRRAIARPS